MTGGSVRIVKQISPRQLLACKNERFYVISESRPEWSQHSFRPVVLIFASDKDGKVTEFMEVGGSTGCNLKEFLEMGPIEMYDG